MSSYFRFACPHCGAKAQTRTSKQITPLVRELYMRCTGGEDEPGCGFQWKSQIEPLYTLVPSTRPNPAVRLPLAKPVAANDDELDDAAQA